MRKPALFVIQSSEEKSPSGQVIGIIPARWASSRFPGKPLHLLNGKPLLQHVYEQAERCKSLDGLLVATDDARIAALCEIMGAPYVITREDHPSGTDRIAEAALSCPMASHFINIQGDEPLLDPQLVQDLVTSLKNDPALEMATAASPIRDEAQINDSNIVKVVINAANDALYFSRSAIPYRRSAIPSLPTFRHLGIYGYRADFLQHFVTLPPSLLEQSEGLEQLRALENGVRIKILITEHEAIGLDSPEQVPFIESLLSQQH